MSLHVKVNSDVIRHLQKRSPEELKRGMHRFITYAEGLAVQNAPVAAEHGGNLRASITSGIDGDIAYLQATAPYARWVHEGTGLFGPKGKKITPKNSRALSWLMGGRRVYFKSIKGMKPRPFLRDAIIQADKDVSPDKLFGATL